MSLTEKVRTYLKRDIDISFPFLHIFQFKEKTISIPQMEKPYIYFVLDGELRLYTPSGTLDYIKGQYSVSAIDTPEKGYILAFSEQQDFLAAAVDFSPNDVMSVMIKIDESILSQILNDELSESYKNQQDHYVFDCLERILDTSEDPVSCEFLCEQIRTEMIFHILCGSCGKAFIHSVTNMKSVGKIYKANSWIKKNYRKSFKIEDIAEQSNMSVSQFHQKFKNAVGMGPLQCQKRLRLTEARRLMLDEGMNATEASLEVGYESVSQFTRDYRKMFGNSPKEDILFLQSIQ